MSHIDRGARRTWLGPSVARGTALVSLLALSCASGGKSPPPGGQPDASEPIDAADEDPIDAADDERPDARRVDARPGDPDASGPDPADAAVIDARPADARTGPDAGPIGGLGPWTGNDRVLPSQEPPFGVPRERTPVFVTLGWDDNSYSGYEGTGGTGGMSWVLDLPNGRTNADGSPIRFSFYFTSTYIAIWGAESPTFLKRAWRAAKVAGHEIGNHTNGHQTSRSTSAAAWAGEIDTCNGWLVKPYDASEPTHTPDASKGIGASAGELYGFRTPFLLYNDSTLSTVAARDFWYDTSIEEGFEEGHDGTNFYWPYTLDNRSPGHTTQVNWGGPDAPAEITPHPGLWEMPVYVVIAPPDDRCAEYGIPTGFRNRLKQRQSWFDVTEGKITGFDFNLWLSFQMTKAEFLATLKYSLDQRRRGNRAPFLFGVHSDAYSSKWVGNPVASLAERQQAIAEFLDYARSKPDVRITTAKNVLDWVRNPVPLP
jgi:hypothetical protein